MPASSSHRLRELAEVGKMAVGAGLGGLTGWVATMAAVSGSGTHCKVWTIWSVLLVAASGVGIVGGAALWWVFRRRGPELPPVINVHPGATINYNAAPAPPQLVNATTSDGMVITTGTFAHPPSLESLLAKLHHP